MSHVDITACYFSFLVYHSFPCSGYLPSWLPSSKYNKTKVQLCLRASVGCLGTPHFYLPLHSHNVPPFFVWILVLIDCTQRPLPIILKIAPSILLCPLSLISSLHNTCHYLNCITYLSHFPLYHLPPSLECQFHKGWYYVTDNYTVQQALLSRWINKRTNIVPFANKQTPSVALSQISEVRTVGLLAKFK